MDIPPQNLEPGELLLFYRCAKCGWHTLEYHEDETCRKCGAFAMKQRGGIIPTEERLKEIREQRKQDRKNNARRDSIYANGRDTTIWSQTPPYGQRLGYGFRMLD